MTTKERIELQIQAGVLDIYSFLALFPFFCLPDEENISQDEKMNIQIKRFRYYISNHPDFPIHKVGRMAVIPLNELQRWLATREKEKSEKSSDRMSVKIKNIKFPQKEEE